MVIALDVRTMEVEAQYKGFNWEDAWIYLLWSGFHVISRDSFLDSLGRNLHYLVGIILSSPFYERGFIMSDQVLK